MAKVAENQDRAEAARSRYVYRQKVLVRMLRTNGKLSREEDREYTVTPGPDGTEREMVHFAGKYVKDGKEFPYAEPGEKYQDKDIDASIVKDIADSFGNDEKSRDGVNEDLFPLAGKKQRAYKFKLAGTETWKGHDVFRITFEPLEKNDKRLRLKSPGVKADLDENTGPREPQDADDDHVVVAWAGEALIDKKDLTPVLITTHLAKGVPLLVKTLLGTNIQQIGFKLSYEKFNDLWFPVSYSGEFKLRVLFLYGRTIAMSLANSGFQKTDVKSAITFEK